MKLTELRDVTTERKRWRRLVKMVVIELTSWQRKVSR